jgi:hypothetical protein
MLPIVLSRDWRRHILLATCLVNAAIDANDIELVMVLQHTDIPEKRVTLARSAISACG